MKNRRIVVGLILVNAVVLLLVLSDEGSANGGSVVPVVRARAFELKGDNGKMRARLNVESGGDVVLRLMDEDGTIRVKIGASKSGSGIVLLNDTTEVGVHLLAKSTGSSIRVVDKNGKERLLVP